MKIALYESQYGNRSPNEVVDWIEEGLDYIRVTEPIEVEFVNLPDVEIIGPQVEALKNEKRKLREDLAVKIQSIDDRISKLTAITHEEG